MKDNILVRRAEPNDADAIAQFNIAMAWETEQKRLDPPTIARGVRAVLDHADYGFYLVATCNEEVAGSLLVTFEWSDWRCGLFWWIQSLYVRPEFRRRGVLKTLHESLAAEAARQGHVCGIRLYVERSNAVAQSAYAALGMQRTGYEIYETLLPEPSTQEH